MRYRAIADSMSAAGKEREREEGADAASFVQDSRRTAMSVARKVRPAAVCQGGTCTARVSGGQEGRRTKDEPWQS